MARRWRGVRSILKHRTFDNRQVNIWHTLARLDHDWTWAVLPMVSFFREDMNTFADGDIGILFFRVPRHGAVDMTWNKVQVSIGVQADEVAFIRL